MENTTAAGPKAPASETKTAAKTVRKAVEPVYTAAQLADGYRAFHTSRAIVECALKLAGKDGFTMGEATQIVTEFRKRG